MQKFVLLTLVFACTAVSAQVYKRVGPDGKVYFSDQPAPDAERIEVAPAQSIHLPPVKPQSSSPGLQGEAAAGVYSTFAIVSPAGGEGVRANDGNVQVRLQIEPALKPGHTITVSIDGADIHTGISTTVQLTGLSRGGHNLKAWVTDRQGKQLLQAEPVDFYVLRVAAGG